MHLKGLNVFRTSYNLINFPNLVKPYWPNVTNSSAGRFLNLNTPQFDGDPSHWLPVEVRFLALQFK